MNTIPPRRRWWQYGLGTLLVIAVIASVPLAWNSMERSWQRRELMALASRLGDSFQIAPAAERAILEKLDAQTRLKFVETPLTEVCDLIEKQHELAIEIDSTALQEAGIAPDAQVSTDVHGVSLRSGLRHTLRGLGLTYVVSDEAVLITTPRRAAAIPAVRLYNVTKLVTLQADANALAQLLQEIYARRDQQQQPDAASHEAGVEVRVAAYESLLVVRAPQSVQDEIAGLLPLLADGLRLQELK